MLYTMEFMECVCKLLDKIDENAYIINAKKLSEKEKERLLSYDESLKMLYGKNKGIINIDKIK